VAPTGEFQPARFFNALAKIVNIDNHMGDTTDFKSVGAPAST